nr:hypothetical protein Iba_chr11eCG0550 [Ipomoea batatas]
MVSIFHSNLPKSFEAIGFGEFLQLDQIPQSQSSQPLVSRQPPPVVAPPKKLWKKVIPPIIPKAPVIDITNPPQSSLQDLSASEDPQTSLVETPLSNPPISSPKHLESIPPFNHVLDPVLIDDHCPQLSRNFNLDNSQGHMSDGKTSQLWFLRQLAMATKLKWAERERTLQSEHSIYSQKWKPEMDLERLQDSQLCSGYYAALFNE